MKPVRPDPLSQTVAAADDVARSDARRRLEALVEAEAIQPVNEDVQTLARELTRNPGVAAVVFYGSGLWEQAGAETLYDFYVVVERFRDWAPGRTAAVAGNWLPPNVYYLEMQRGAARLRCKYAVIRRTQVAQAARGESFTPHIWARFCQPSRLLYARDASVKAALIRAFADAVVTFHKKTLPLTEAPSIEAFWEAGLRATYASEIRSEKVTRPAKLVAASREAFRARTRLALALCPTVAWLTPEETVVSALTPSQKQWRRRWMAVQRPLQKAVPLGRLIKAGFTFHGGIDYLRWKIERHSGVVITVTDFQRRHPVLAGLFLLWKTVRRGGVR